MCFRILEWDSEFFGFSTALITIPMEEHRRIPGIVTRMKEHRIKLAYWMIPEPWSPPSFLSGCRRVVPADIKVTYSIQPDQIRESIPVARNGVIEEYNRSVPEPEMLQLARLSGHCSRFKTDPMFSPDLFTRMYDVWMVRSVNHQLALAVYAYRCHGRPVGMVTLESHPPVSRIGLIAVDPDHQGQGIAQVLIQQSLQRACREKFSELRVSTQQANHSACRLYTRCGFRLAEQEFVYHFWLD